MSCLHRDGHAAVNLRRRRFSDAYCHCYGYSYLNGYSYLSTMNGLNFPSAVVDLLRTGRTPYLSFKDARPVRNFVVGFRELPVKDWCAHAA